MLLIELLTILHDQGATWWATGDNLWIQHPEPLPVHLAAAITFYRPILLQLAQHTPDGRWPRSLPRRAEAS